MSQGRQLTKRSSAGTSRLPARAAAAAGAAAAANLEGVATAPRAGGRRAVVVGAGPAGSLMAMFLAQRGYQVEVYERRSRPRRDDSQYSLRSYPMIISQRAMQALSQVGARPLCLRGPCTKGYFVLNTGQMQRMPAGAWQVDRVTLGADMTAEAERLFPQHIKFVFGHALEDISLDQQTAILHDTATSGSRKVPYDLLIGADGASSRVRELLQRSVPGFKAKTRLVAKTGYKTFHGLRVPANAAEANGMAVGDMAAHEQGAFLYGLKSPDTNSSLWKAQDGTISGIMTFYTELSAEETGQLLRKAWPFLPPAWHAAIVEQTSPEAQSWNSFSKIVQCSQFHGPRIALVGDAAHALTSAMGQGCNTAMEGCRLLAEALVRHGDDYNAALSEFTRLRRPDVRAVQDLEYMRVISSPRAKSLYSNWLTRAYAGFLFSCVEDVGAALHRLAPRLFPNAFFMFARLAQPEGQSQQGMGIGMRGGG
ncbi:hypothetical protein WJX72_000365 [[Myrmecia] bisecta]|uniref:FAD-binding domain-containing protein n=1 Tax=[Myrmecia] bisecta TaxID=41462 RepID=A0AAW1P6T9_9CHLO